ncbi:hypothetical protein [Halochromatium glycolicum]|uniref:hypothetical protein n=1 Tax=Halochromatium glycolicum TaxID=85075 RepID=UPI00190D598D|nr:hypothetical protein [Halochromatium glycolicum]
MFSTRTTRWLRRSALAFGILAALYWSGVNLALNLPLTRDALNRMQPEQFAVDWTRAWSWYPLRVAISGLAADGQTPSEQWQLDAGRAAVSLSLLPLLRGELRVHDLDLEHIDLRLRPRPRPDSADDASDALRAFFPVIRNRDPDAVAEPAPEPTGTDLVLEIDDVHIRGEHAFWVSHLRGWLPGEVRGSVRMDTASSELALADGALDLSLKSLRVGDRTPVREAAALKGTVAIPPVRLSTLEGLDFLRIATVDAEIDLPVDNLDFLALVVPGLEPLELEGQGRLQGRIRLDQGEALRGTDLLVEANALAMTLGRFHFAGDGLVELQVDPQNEAAADLNVTFDRVVGELAAGGGEAANPTATLFSGYGLTAALHVSEADPSTTSTATEIEALAEEVEVGFRLEVPGMRVADLSVYNRLLPATWDLTLLGGSGLLHALFEVTPERLSLELDLASDEADLRYADYRATTDMLLELRARVDAVDTPTLHLEGTRLRLSDAQLGDAQLGDTRLSGAESAAAEPWEAELAISGGTLSLPTPGADADPIPRLANQLAEEGFGSLLASGDGELAAALKVSELDWIAALLNRPLGLTLDGAAEIDAALRMEQGLLATGSRLAIPPVPLSLALLEHRIDGRGEAALQVERGGPNPNVRLRVELDEGRMRRRDEAEPSIGGARLDAVVAVGALGAKAAESARVDLVLHGAEVKDMAVYNAYLPEDAPISLLGGAARLMADLELSEDSAEGNLLLTTEDISIALDEQQVIGALQLDVLVRDGAPNAMRFDITGSSLRFDEFRVIGAAASDQRAQWHARLQLEETEIVWDKPVELRMKADVTVQDTRPFVALIDNLRGKPSWIDELLSVEDLAGHLQIQIADDQVVIEDALLSSPEIGVHAKGLASADTREAMLLLRWHNLSGAVALHEDEKAFRLVNAVDQFEAYRPGKTPFGSVAAQRLDGATTTASEAQRAPRGAETALDLGSLDQPAPTEADNPFLNEDL